MYNKVILLGRLCADPNYSQTQSGTALCRFRIAVERRFTDRTTGQRETDFFSCSAFGKTAEFIDRFFRKGSAILVEGEVQNNPYTDKSGVKHYADRIVVQQASFTGEKSGDSTAKTASQGAYQPAASRPPEIPPELGDLGDFEDILGESELPF